MRTKAFFVLTVSMALLLSAGCSDVTIGDGGNRVDGSGTIATEQRDVSNFTAIEVIGAGDVTIGVTGAESLSITADDNLLPLLTSEVKGGKLTLGVDSDSSISPSETIKYQITVAELTRMSIVGFADTDISGLDTALMEVDISGSGDVVLSGTAESFEVAIRGAGDINGEALAAERASVSIAGSGFVIVNASSELDISISGSGDVEYLGSPALTQTISGTGSVTSR